MSEETQRYLAFNTLTDAVEVIGTQQEVLDKLSEVYGNAQLDQLEVYPIGQKMGVRLVFSCPPEPSV